MFEAEFWVFVAFVILMGVLGYFGVHRTILSALDHRRDRIQKELDDARRLKEEAAKLVEEYRSRRASAEREAQDIVTSAKAEAERIAAEAKDENGRVRRTPHEDRRKQDRPGRKPGDCRRSCSCSGSRGLRRHLHHGAVGSRVRGGRIDFQGNRRRSQQAELIGRFSTQ